MWYPNYKKQYCTSQEEMFRWNTVLYQCPNFSTKSQNDLNYHIAKKHSAQKLDVTFKCKLCYQEFPGFYALRQHININTELKSDQEQKIRMWNTKWEMLMMTSWEESCVLVNISWWIRNLKGRDTRCSLTQWKLLTKQLWTRNLTIFSKKWIMQQNGIWLWVSFWKI